jgi:hypothetical protein
MEMERDEDESRAEGSAIWTGEAMLRELDGMV